MPGSRYASAVEAAALVVVWAIVVVAMVVIVVEAWSWCTPTSSPCAGVATRAEDAGGDEACGACGDSGGAGGAGGIAVGVGVDLRTEKNDVICCCVAPPCEAKFSSCFERFVGSDEVRCVQT